MEQNLSTVQLNLNRVNENALVSTKIAMEATPRKIPFRDNTNKTSELQKSAVKSKSTSDFASPQKKQLALDDLDDFGVDFEFPSDKDCFCCGKDHRSLGEIWGEGLALSEEFLDRMASMDDKIPYDDEDRSVSPEPEIKFLDIIESDVESVHEMKIPFDESLYTTAVDFDDGCLDVSKHQASDVNSSLVIPEMDLESNNGDSLDSSLDSSLVIPEMDLESDNGDSLDSSLDSSFEIPEINFESDYEDNSIISHW